jgi:hypothetical protein
MMTKIWIWIPSYHILTDKSLFLNLIYIYFSPQRHCGYTELTVHFVLVSASTPYVESIYPIEFLFLFWTWSRIEFLVPPRLFLLIESPLASRLEIPVFKRTTSISLFIFSLTTPLRSICCQFKPYHHHFQKVITYLIISLWSTSIFQLFPRCSYIVDASCMTAMHFCFIHYSSLSDFLLVNF